MKLLIVALLCLAPVFAILVENRHTDPTEWSHEDLKNEFARWVSAQGKLYGSLEEYETRRLTFHDNMLYAHSAQSADQGTAVYGATQFADMPREEFAKRFLSSTIPAMNGVKEATVEKVEVPQEFDWVAKGRVAPVQNQGGCGSCWAFSTITSLETVAAVKNGTAPTKLSEQYLVDCSEQDNGCNGGLMELAYEDIIKMGGVPSERAYPYRGTDMQCTSDPRTFIQSVKDYEFVKSEDEIHSWVYQHGTVAIAADATTWQFYLGGVSANPLCGKGLNHGIAITGWGVAGKGLHKGKTYHIIRNSWGESWGEKGYIWIVAGHDYCGVADHVVGPIL